MHNKFAAINLDELSTFRWSCVLRSFITSAFHMTFTESTGALAEEKSLSSEVYLQLVQDCQEELPGLAEFSAACIDIGHPQLLKDVPTVVRVSVPK